MDVELSFRGAAANTRTAVGKDSPLPVEGAYAESAVAPVLDTLTGIGDGNQTFTPTAGRWFNLSISGTFTGGGVVKRKFPGRDDWRTVSRDSAGTQAAYTAGAEIQLFEPKAGTLYRFDCTALSAGEIEIEWNT